MGKMSLRPPGAWESHIKREVELRIREPMPLVVYQIPMHLDDSIGGRARERLKMGALRSREFDAVNAVRLRQPGVQGCAAGVEMVIGSAELADVG